MTAKVILISRYRDIPRLKNGVISWGGDCRCLDACTIRSLAEYCHDALMYREGTWSTMGFLIDARDNWFTISGWEFEPVRLSLDEFEEFTHSLAVESGAQIARNN